MTTRAIQILSNAKISFRVIRYNHKEKGARYASQAIGFPLEKTVKTLVAQWGPKNYLLALAPGSCRVSTKNVAKVYNVKRVALTDPVIAERITGYRIGGISPFGTRDTLPVVMDSTLFEFDEIALNGGQRGIMLILSPTDIQILLNAKVGDIVDKNR